MFAYTLDVVPLPHMSAPVIAYRHEAATWPRLPRHQGFLAIRYEHGNALTTTLQNVGLRKDPLSDYQPRTELGKQLLALRQAYVASGGRLSTSDALEYEKNITDTFFGIVVRLAEKSLAEDWLRPEEDEAWAHLQ